MDSYDSFRKYRELNSEYLYIVGKIKRNRDAGKSAIAARSALDNTIWQAETAMEEAITIPDPRQREVAVQIAQDALREAEEVIRNADALCNAITKERDVLKREIIGMLNAVRHDAAVSEKIDVALLLRFRHELDAKERNHTATLAFYDKLGIVQDTLSGIGALPSDGDGSIHLEYDATLTSITSLTDMIDYFQTQEAKLRSDIIEPREDDGKPSPKTDEQKREDATKADELLEVEIRPRRIDRARNREKLAEIIHSQARKVDLDPRDLEGIHTVEAMQSKRVELLAEAKALEAEIIQWKKIVKLLEHKTSGGLVKSIVGLFSKKHHMDGHNAAESTDTSTDNALIEPEETPEERFTYRYKLTQRELNRRYNAYLEHKDNITEHAYVEEEDEA
jgi:hypothetical protein